MLKLFTKILITLLILIISCTSSENNSDESKIDDELDINIIASEKYGENFSLNYNTSKEYVICKNKGKLKATDNVQIKYFIYDVNKNVIIEEGVIPLGDISWVSNFEVKVEIHSGMIQKNVEPNNGYILNVLTNLKTKINGGVH